MKYLIALGLVLSPVPEVMHDKPQTIEQIIVEEASKKGVSPTLAVAIARCESSLRHKAIGDSGKSRGIWQIHKDYHDMPDSFAFDVASSTEWAIKQMSEGRYWLWSCYKIVNGTNPQ